jgi:succinate dehydrogenase/fumarate reductase cytochrome b subunit
MPGTKKEVFINVSYESKLERKNFPERWIIFREYLRFDIILNKIDLTMIIYCFVYHKLNGIIRVYLER